MHVRGTVRSTRRRGVSEPTHVPLSVFTPAEQADVDAYIAALLAKAPPLSDEKRDRLSLLLRPARRRSAA
jgi:hypothetical protein